MPTNRGRNFYKSIGYIRNSQFNPKTIKLYVFCYTESILDIDFINTNWRKWFIWWNWKEESAIQLTIRSLTAVIKLTLKINFASRYFVSAELWFCFKSDLFPKELFALTSEKKLSQQQTETINLDRYHTNSCMYWWLLRCNNVLLCQNELFARLQCYKNTVNRVSALSDEGKSKKRKEENSQQQSSYKINECR